MKKVLTIIDAHTKVEELMKFAVTFARQMDAQIGLADITPYASGELDAGVTPGNATDNNRTKALAILDQLKNEYPDLNYATFGPVGDPTQEIKKIVDEWQADLIIIGHHTHKGLHHFFSAQTDQELIEHLAIPVLVMPDL